MFAFGAHLKALRQSRNLTQKQLAVELGISERGVQHYEIGERKPTYDALIALADYFDVSLDYLVGRSDCPHRLQGEQVEIVSPEELELLRRHRESG